MDAARQVIRWAVPGTMLLISMGGCLLVALTVNEQAVEISLKKDDGFPLIADNFLTLAALSVPIGFIIYQIYYFMYFHFPFPWIAKLLVDPIDKGDIILADVKEDIKWKDEFGRWELLGNRQSRLDKCPHPPPEKGSAYKKGSVRYWPCKIRRVDHEIVEKFHENWTLAQSVWYLTLRDDKYNKIAAYLERRKELLGDIYHSLGANITATCLAFIFCFPLVFIHFLYNQESYWFGRFGIATFINFVITLSLAKIFSSGRRHSGDDMLRLMHDVITSGVSRTQQQEQTNAQEDK